jgi:ER membrane protein complex subunit 2
MQSLQDIHQHLYLSTPGNALHLSQQAPLYLNNHGQQQIFPTFLSNHASDNSNQWSLHEQLLLTCLRTGDDKSAHLCLEKLTERFGRTNERIMALRGLYQEATAADEAALKSILQDYERILVENPVNVV